MGTHLALLIFFTLKDYLQIYNNATICSLNDSQREAVAEYIN